MALAASPLNGWWLAWVALVPLWALVLGRGEKEPHKPFAVPFAWGVGYHGLALSWIMGLHPLTWLGVPWLASVAIALFCWGFITCWGSALVVIWALVMRFITPRLPKVGGIVFFRVLLGTAFWCGLESLWSLTPLNWTSLSYTQSPGNLVILHLGQLSGPMTVTAVIVAFNGLLAEAWIAKEQKKDERKKKKEERQEIGDRAEKTGDRSNFFLVIPSFNRSIGSLAPFNLFPFPLRQNPTPYSLLPTPHFLLLIALLLFISSHLIGYVLYCQPLAQPEAMALKIGLVQGNVPTRIKLSGEGIRRAFRGYVGGYEALADQGVDGVLTPEGALPVLWEPGQNPFRRAVRNRGIPAWLGVFVRQDGRITQSLLSIAGNGDVVGRYNKMKLVPLGEYTPFREILGGLINRLSPIQSEMQPGNSAQRFNTPFGLAIASICYESAFPELFRAQAADGGEFILTASNLDPYGEGLMAQHQAQDLMRAIETDRWAVRATNTGYSGLIDPHGQVHWQSQPRTYQIHVGTIYRRQSKTLYVRWGNWLTLLLLTLTALFLGLQWICQSRIS